MPRPRIQFGLRTLLIIVVLVAIPCAVVGWELHYIRQRQAALAWLRDGGGWVVTTAEYQQLPGQAPRDPSGPTMQIPAWRRWLGDEPIAEIGFASKISAADRERVRELFPEADVSNQ